jgi:hypothetical protein
MRRHNRDGDLLLGVGALQNLPPVVDMEQLLETRVDLIDTSLNIRGAGKSRPVGNYSLRDLMTKLL